MKASPALRSFRLSSILLVGLSMAIGWGIRGNFGHQYGAAFAGCLASIALSLLSGREDWRSKLLYFAFFGAIGWGFGATISYMQVISYTESGQAWSQWYGYICLFIIGFLWAALGVAATALVAVADFRRLTQLFKPVLFVFGSWLLLDLVEDPVAAWLAPGINFDDSWTRHKNPLYWFDANYLPSLFALMAMGLYDLLERKEKNSLLLPLYAFGGLVAGWLIQSGIRMAGWEQALSSVLTYSLGDASYINPETGLPAFDIHNLLTNWPSWFSYYPQYIGGITGLIAGIIIYFIRYGKFRQGSSLIVYMAGGWLLFFLAFPVLGSLFFAHHGGIRMTPPRSDDWAGIAGVFAGTLIWMRRNNYFSVAIVSILGGIIGGLGFSGIQWIKQIMMAPGNPRILAARGILPGSSQYENIVSSWANWQQQNWHSFLEQSYGFVNGVAVAIALGLLAKRLPVKTFAPETAGQLKIKRWTTGVCAVFTLLVIPYVNLVKNVDTWSQSLNPEIWFRKISSAGGLQQKMPAYWDVPYIGRLPAIHFLHLTPEGWFNMTWILLFIAFVALVRRHAKHPLAIVPKTWVGKGQLILLLLLWIMVIGNFERALTQWTPSRLLTEWVITLDAIVLSFFVLILPGESGSRPAMAPVETFNPSYKRSWALAISAVVISSAFFLLTNRMIYQYGAPEKPDLQKYHTRFGPEADWRSKPILKNGDHR